MGEAVQMPENLRESILEAIDRKRRERGRILVAIDGRCGSGKTTLAVSLLGLLSCNLFHMDSFYLRPGQRTKERREEPGGNVDYERFRREVLLPLRRGEPFSYRPFNCERMALADPVSVRPSDVELVEGSYACHPTLYDFYDLHIFLTVSPEEQMRRILRRNGEKKAEQFRTLWIPLEERYFAEFQVEKHCDLCFDTTGRA